MLTLLASVAVAFLASGAQMPQPGALPERVAEEAELLAQKAPMTVSVETLVQLTLATARRRPVARWRSRQIVSEYTVAPLKGSISRSLVEYRQVVSVDGRVTLSPEAARRTLSLGIESPDDSLRKRMLEEFAGYGLSDVATDYALLLLLFTNRGMEGLEISPAGETYVGAEDTLAFSWRQTAAGDGALLFTGREATRQALHGTIWIRRADGLPLRILASTTHDSPAGPVRDEATIDYVMSAHGFLTPASVHHQHVVNGAVRTENLYRYEPFKLFAADARIVFAPEAPSAPPEGKVRP